MAFHLTSRMGGGGFAVASHDLLEAIGDDLDRIQADEDSGGVYSVAQLVASSITGITADGFYRKLRLVRSGTQLTLNAEVAEALTMAIGNWHLSELNIPTIPRSKAAAVEMLEAWDEVWGDGKTNELETQQLARSMQHFACGYICTFEDVDTVIEQEAWATYVALFAEEEAWATYEELFGESQVADAELVAA